MPVKKSGHDTGSDCTFQKGVTRYLESCFRVLMRNLEGSLTGEIMESLHDLRTSARRIETIFDIFGAYFRPRKIDRQKEIFHSLVRSAGSVRECDVFIGMLDTMQREDDGPESVGINLLRARIVHQRNRNRPGLNRRLNMIGKKNFRRTFTDCITSMRLVYSNSDRLTTGIPDSFREAGREILPRLYRRFSKQLRIAIDHECTIKKLHDARLAGKPLRYSMEMFESVFGKKFKRALDNIRDLLRILGEIHDCDIAIAAIDQMLREIGIYNSFIRTDDRIFSVERLRHLLVDQQLKRRSLESELQPIAERWTSRAQRKRFGLALQ